MFFFFFVLPVIVTCYQTHTNYPLTIHRDFSLHTFHLASLWILLAGQVQAVLASCAYQQRTRAKGHAPSAGSLSAHKSGRSVSEYSLEL